MANKEEVLFEGIEEIPSNGKISYTLPEIPAYSGNGFNSYAIVVEATNSTAINKRALTTEHGEIKNPSQLGSVLLQVYRQYSAVNINVTAKLPVVSSGTVSYTANDYNPGYSSGLEPHIGGLVIGSTKNQLIKRGVPGAEISNLDYFINELNQESGAVDTPFEFRIKVDGGAGKFMLDPDVKELKTVKGVGTGKYAFESSYFEPTHKENGDLVTFSGLTANIGEGVSGSNDQYATVSGMIHYKKFGKLSQLYVLRLDKIFIY